MYRKNTRVLVVVLVLMVLVSEMAMAKSLWCANSFFASLVSDKRACKIGDLLTIIVLEKSNATQQATTSTDKNSGVDAGPGLGLLDFIPLLALNTSNKSQAKGTTVRGGRIEAELTVQIVGITERGNFLIYGEQEVIINEGKQVISISGVVRPEDIQKDNTVLSTNVADAVIEYKGEGAVDKTQSTGILTRIFNWLF
jgi:flagellar L-ring protein precursor FlgH